MVHPLCCRAVMMVEAATVVTKVLEAVAVQAVPAVPFQLTMGFRRNLLKMSSRHRSS